MGMRRNKALALLAGLALAFGSAAACGGKGNNTGGGGTTETGVVGKAKKEGKLVIGVKADQPGLGLQTGGKYEGFDVEIAKIIAKDLGLSEDKIEWKTTTTPNREPFIQQGTVDLVVATYTINDDRKKKVNFAGPYYVAGQDLLVKVDNTTITGPDSHAGQADPDRASEGGPAAVRLVLQVRGGAGPGLGRRGHHRRHHPRRVRGAVAVRRQAQGGGQAVQHRAVRHRSEEGRQVQLRQDQRDPEGGCRGWPVQGGLGRHAR